MDEKIWRISSLTARIDDDTKILVLPVPESKRQNKVIDTKYILQKYSDILKLSGDSSQQV